MRVRPTPLAHPPDRDPYFRVRVLDQEIVLRTPAPHRFVRLAHALNEPQESVAMIAMQAAVVGFAWADPVLELETARIGTDQDIAEYGAAVLDELHEAGWGHRHVVGASLSVLKELTRTVELDEEVTSKAAFFPRPKALSNESSSPSSPGTSAAAPSES